MLEYIETLRKATANAIREYCRSRKDLWQRVPWLALQVDGKGGYSDTRRVAYTSGRWRLRCCYIFVNCATGELVNYDNEPIADHLIIGLSLNEIDAEAIVEDLECFVDRPDSDLKVKAWREQTIKEYNLKEIYEEEKF